MKTTYYVTGNLLITTPNSEGVARDILHRKHVMRIYVNTDLITLYMRDTARITLYPPSKDTDLIAEWILSTQRELMAWFNQA